MGPDTALPLNQELDLTQYYTMPDDDNGTLTIRSSEDGRTVQLFDPTDEPRNPDDDAFLTFHPLQGHADFLIVQGYGMSTLNRTREYGYGLGGCDTDGNLTIYRYEPKKVMANGPIVGITQEGDYIPTATTREGLVTYYKAAIATGTVQPYTFRPAIPCAMVFD